MKYHAQQVVELFDYEFAGIENHYGYGQIYCKGSHRADKFVEKVVERHRLEHRHFLFDAWYAVGNLRRGYRYL